MLHVKRNDRGLTCSSLFTDVLAPCLGGVSRGRFENLDDNFEKKLVLLVEERALVSCVVRGAPTPLYVLLFCRFCPLWNVDRLGTFRGKRLLELIGDTGVLFEELDRKGSRGWSKGERSTRPGPAPVPAEIDADLK